MSLSIVFSQVAGMPSSWYGEAADGLEAMRSGTDLSNNLVGAFPIGSEFSMFPCTNYDLHAPENKVTHMNRLQSH